jgi:hypothetical protein
MIPGGQSVQVTISSTKRASIRPHTGEGTRLVLAHVADQVGGEDRGEGAAGRHCTLADALEEAKLAKPRNDVHIASLQLAIIAERHRVKLLKLGYTIEMSEDGIKITPPALPKRKARTA